MLNKLRPNEQRAKTAIILIWVVMVMDIISLISGYFQYNLLQAAANGEELTMEAANANDLREQLIAIVALIALIASGITFIQWFRRAYYNLHQRVDTLAHTEGWASGAWFVPILCLYRPYQIMKELYFETKYLLEKKGVPMEGQLSTAALGPWWTLWIVNAFAGQISARVGLNADSIDQLTTATVFDMISNIVGIPLAIVTVRIIKNYSSVEPMLRVMPVDAGPEAAQVDQSVV